MALKDLFSNLFKKDRNMQYAKMLNGHTPVFSQFGQNIFASDVVQMCIEVIASELSKSQPKHIRTDSNGAQVYPKSSLNRLFKFSPNPLMTTRDFIEKIVWLLYQNYNVFIFPTYEIFTDNNGKHTLNYTGFYPLNPVSVTFLQDATGTLFLEMQFNNGDKHTIAYSEIIHLRKKFSVNDVMGGGMNGQPDNAPLLKVLTINDTVLQGLDKAIKTSLSVRGILRINTMLDDEKQQKERARLEQAVTSGDSSIIALDLKGDYIPLDPDPKIIDKDTLEFLQNKVLNYYGVSVPILTGDFNDEQYQAFYEKTLEPIIISLGQAFSKILFTPRELDMGNEIRFYQKDMMYLSTKTKLELLKITGEQGLLSDNQKLAILGYPPVEGGHRVTQSLNYMDKKFITQYQLSKAGKKGTEGNDDE